MDRIKRALPLSFFVFWLISFPMNGFLMQGISVGGSLIYFLLPHAITLFAAPHLINSKCFDRYAKSAVILTAFLTALTPFLQIYINFFLIILGITGSLVFFRALTIVKDSSDPAVSAGMGMAIGNGLVFLLSNIQLWSTAKFFAIALFMLISFYYSTGYSDDKQGEGLKKDLAFVFGFYLIGGLFYGSIMPKYDETAILKGSELFSYIIAAIMGISLIKKERDLTLAMGIILSAVAFSLMLFDDRLLTNLSMFSLQASFALVDIYIICLLIGHGGSMKVFGYGFGTVCLAIMAGEAFSKHIEDFTAILIATGNIILITSVLILYLTGRKQKVSLVAVSDNPQDNRILAGREGRSSLEGAENIDKMLENLYEPFQKRLSEQERHVLELIVVGRTYKETSEKIGISESTVKTYMKRICEKMGVDGKDKLLEKISKTGSFTRIS